MINHGAAPEHPFYAKMEQDKLHVSGTQMWMITCDEGWRVSIVCTDMYEWAADWLLPHIQGKPYARQYNSESISTGE